MTKPIVSLDKSTPQHLPESYVEMAGEDVGATVTTSQCTLSKGVGNIGMYPYELIPSSQRQGVGAWEEDRGMNANGEPGLWVMHKTVWAVFFLKQEQF